MSLLSQMVIDVAAFAVRHMSVTASIFNSTCGRLVISIGNQHKEIPQEQGAVVTTGLQTQSNVIVVKAAVLDGKGRHVKTSSVIVPFSNRIDLHFGNETIQFTGGRCNWQQDLVEFYNRQDDLEAQKLIEADLERKRLREEEEKEARRMEADVKRREAEETKKKAEEAKKTKALQSSRVLSLLSNAPKYNAQFALKRFINSISNYSEEGLVLKELLRLITTLISRSDVEFDAQDVTILNDKITENMESIFKFCFLELIELLKTIILKLKKAENFPEIDEIVYSYVEATIHEDLTLLLSLDGYSRPVPESWISVAKAVLLDTSSSSKSTCSQQLIAFVFLAKFSPNEICQAECFKAVATAIQDSCDLQNILNIQPYFLGIIEQISEDHLVYEDLYSMLESFTIYLGSLKNDQHSQILPICYKLLSTESLLRSVRTEEMGFFLMKHAVKIKSWDQSGGIPDKMMEILTTYLQDTGPGVNAVFEIVFQLALKNGEIPEELRSILKEKEEVFHENNQFRWAMEITKELEETLENNNWISDWAQKDPTGLLEFLRDEDTCVSKKALKVQGYMALANSHEEAGDHFGALELINECLTSTLFCSSELDYNEELQGSNYPEFLRAVLLSKGTVLYKSGELSKAQDILGLLEGEECLVILEEMQQFAQLKTFEFLEGEVEEGSVAFLLKEIDKKLQETTETNVNLLSVLLNKLGPISMTEVGRDLIQFLVDLDGKYDPELILEHEPQNWMTEALHSRILFKGRKPPQGFQEMWDSLITYHNSGVKDNATFCIRFFNMFIHFEQDLLLELEELSEKLNLICFLFHIPDIPEDFITLETLQKLWVQQFFPDEQEGSMEFWSQVESVGFLSSTENMMLLHEICTLFVASGETLEEFISLSDTANKLAFNPPFLLSIIQKCIAQRGKFDATFMNEQAQLGFMENSVNQIFHDKIMGESTTQISDNCKLLCQKLLETWAFDGLKSVMELFTQSLTETEDLKKKRKILSTLCQLLNTLASYNFPGDDHKKILSLIQSHPTHEIVPQLKPFCVKAISPSGDGSGRDRDTLFFLLEKLNTSNPGYLEELQDIRELLDSIPDCQDSAEYLLSWSKSGDYGTLTTYLSKIIRAVELFMKFKPRDTQLVSFLSMVQSYEKGGSGRLGKIQTGEGKSIIVAMLATYLALKGNMVDIITCSTVLAQRDAEEFRPFYAMFGLSSGEASGNQAAKGTPKPCYFHNILYGDPSTFQADILRDEFSLLNTRGGRKFDIVIVDEVDSMLIDQGGHSTRLVDKMPGMDNLEAVYLLIWFHLEKLEGFLVDISGDLFFVQPVLGANATNLCSILAIVTGTYGSEVQLLKALQEFSSKCKNEELLNEGAKEAVRTLIENGAIGEYDKSPEGITDAAIETEIEKRWNLSTPESIRRIAELFLNIEILVLEMDKEEGFVPSKVFHSHQSHNHQEGKGEKLSFLQMPEGLLQLIPVSNRKEFIKRKVISEVNDMIEFAYNGIENQDTKKFVLPVHLKNIYQAKLGKWIESAITAKFHVAPDRDYLLKKNEHGEMQVVPIDFENTGVLQDGTVWSDGLHQFLQIRHKLALTPEHLATNFLSNLVFFRRYGKNIYGLTGTMGSVPERALLSSVYFVETVDIPTFKEKQHHSLSDIAALSSTHWLASIATSVLSHINLGRGILIVCKSISDVNIIEAYLAKHLKNVGEISRDFSRYTRTDVDSEVAEIAKKMFPGGVTIATNLAGRGTDIKLDDEMVSNGGLHVCITFLPGNVRVEEQALGRASRKGQPGSSQLIFNLEVDALFPNLLNPLDPIEIKERRNLDEAEKIEQIRFNTIPSMEMEENDFRKYLSIRNELRQGLEADKTMAKYAIASVDEHWGMLLDSTKCRGVKELGGRIEELKHQYLKTGNPHYSILMGNSYNARGEYANACSSYDIAVALDSTFSGLAHYYKAYSIIADDGEKEKAAEELVKAANLINKVNIPALLGCQQLGCPKSDTRDLGKELSAGVTIESQSQDSPFTKQVVNKISVLQALAKSVEEGLEVINKNKEVLAEMVGIEDYFRDKKRIPPDSEIAELRESGLIGFITIKKKPPPWYAFFVVILVGVLEVVAGAALAICTAGAFGTGLITDGVADCITGIKAAVNGEHISLGDFFKQKAITLAISIIAAGVGAALSAAASTISSFVTNMGTKFASTGIGSAIKSIGKSIGKFVSEAWKATQKFATKVWEGTTKFLGKVATTLKLDKAWTFLQNQWTKVKDWVQDKWTKFTSKPAVSNMLTPIQKEQLKLATKLVGKEVGKALILEGIDLILDNAVMTPVTDAIQSSLNAKIREDCFQRLNSNPAVLKYFSQAKTKSEFDALTQKFTSTVLSIINNDFGTKGAPEGVEYLFQGISAVSEEVKRIMEDKDNKFGHRNIIAKAVQYTATFILESAKFGLLVDQLRKYVPQVFTQLEKEFEEEEAVAVSSPFIETDAGKKDFEEAKALLAEEMGKSISTYMAEMITSGAIKPKLDFGVGWMVDKIKGLKTDKLLEDFAEAQSMKHPNRRPNASIWDLMKKEESFDGTTYPFKKQQSTNIQLLSQETNRPIEVYKRNSKGEVELDKSSSTGKLGRANTTPNIEPIRLLSTVLPSRSKSDSGVRYDPILPSETGEFVIAKSPKVGNSGIRDDTFSLIMATTTQSGSADLANLIYKMRIKENAEKFKSAMSFPV